MLHMRGEARKNSGDQFTGGLENHVKKPALCPKDRGSHEGSLSRGRQSFRSILPRIGVEASWEAGRPARSWEMEPELGRGLLVAG